MEFGGHCQTFFDNVIVPESHMIGQVNKGFSIIESLFQCDFCGISGGIGAMQRIYENMREFAKQRIGGGKPIIEHTSIARMMGKIGAQLEAVRALLYRGAWESDQAKKTEVNP
jgi:alkylation response protein AidB-like acyl-CoA dehydrogenase